MKGPHDELGTPGALQQPEPADEPKTIKPLLDSTIWLYEVAPQGNANGRFSVITESS